MKTRGILVLTLCALVADLHAQYKYGLTPMRYDQYLESVKRDPSKELVDLEKHIPGIVLDIRYATTNNFTGEKIYDIPKAYARKPVADALKRVQQDLSANGLGLKIFDGYRPYRATVKFMKCTVTLPM
jgi:D-alanyl-D-alanine dipeptidase